MTIILSDLRHAPARFLAGLAPYLPGAREQLARPADTTGPQAQPGYAIRVDYPHGDHDFWAWRPKAGTTRRLQRRYAVYYHGYVTAMTVVPITRREFELHAEYSRCRAGNCPHPTNPDHEPRRTR